MTESETQAASNLRKILRDARNNNGDEYANAIVRGFLAACVGDMVVHLSPRQAFDVLTHLQDTVFLTLDLENEMKD